MKRGQNADKIEHSAEEGILPLSLLAEIFWQNYQFLKVACDVERAKIRPKSGIAENHFSLANPECPAEDIICQISGRSTKDNIFELGNLVPVGKCVFLIF